MRCREALRSIGPYIDGELAGAKREALKSHLEACPGCRRRMASLRETVREVSSLPPIRPTPAESARLLSRVRSEMERPAAARPGEIIAAPARPALRWAHVTAAAVSILVLVTGAAALAILESGGPAVRVEEAAPETEARESGAPFDKGSNISNLGAEGYAGTEVDSIITASLAQPAVVVSGREYAPPELEDFRGDVATRRKFYSAYWQPQAARATAAAETEELQRRLTDDLAAQAQAAGADPQALRSAVDSALAQADGEGLLPCYAELAKVEGREVWLVSFSGPEDFLLFPDAGMPQSMVLASLSGEEGLKVSWSVLKELAAMLAPYHAAYPASEPLTWSLDESGANTRPSEEGGKARPEEPQPGADTDTTAPDVSTSQESRQRDVQAFLDEVAAGTGNLDALKALEGLNYEQVLMLLAGDWAALAAEGVNLSEFLVPPQRVYAVDAATAEVIWSP